MQHQEEPSDGWGAWTSAVTVGGVLPKNVVYIRHSKAVGIKYIQWHADLCLIRLAFLRNSHCWRSQLNTRFKHQDNRRKTGRPHEHPENCLRLNTGRKGSSLDVQTNNDLWLWDVHEAAGDSFWIADAVKAPSSLLVDFAIDPSGLYYVRRVRTHQKTANWQ